MVFLVEKIAGGNIGQVYAMKIVKKTSVLSKKKSAEHAITERQVLEMFRGSSFVVQLHYAFQTDTLLVYVMGIVLLNMKLGGLG